MIVNINTATVNSWWDNLPHNSKSEYIAKMNLFNWGDVICISAISKYQKNELYQQVHGLNNKNLK